METLKTEHLCFLLCRLKLTRTSAILASEEWGSCPRFCLPYGLQILSPPMVFDFCIIVSLLLWTLFIMSFKF